MCSRGGAGGKVGVCGEGRPGKAQKVRVQEGRWNCKVGVVGWVCGVGEGVGCVCGGVWGGGRWGVVVGWGRGRGQVGVGVGVWVVGVGVVGGKHAQACHKGQAWCCGKGRHVCPVPVLSCPN